MSATVWSFDVRGGLGRDHAARLHPSVPGFPARRKLRVFARDPSLGHHEGSVFTIAVPFEPLNPGPVGNILVVEDIDESSGTAEPPVDLEAPALLMEDGLAPSSTRRQFMQQMVYAVGMETYSCFVRALGRDPGFGALGGDAARDGRLRLRPSAFRGANAYYDRERGMIKFGYDTAAEFASGRSQHGSQVFTSLTREIIAHEMSHALLDGLRPNFSRPTHSDILALHEGFADIVAVFLRFSQIDMVERAMENTQGTLRDNLLVAIGRQFGYDLISGQNPLRTAIWTPGSNKELKEKDLYEHNIEPHDRGSVLLSAVFEAYSEIFERRTAKLKFALATYQGKLPREGIELLAKEACQLARIFLELVIRAIDYCPPFHCTFGEFLRAAITADRDLTGADHYGYREAVITAFRRFGITVPDVATLSEESLLWRGPASGTILVPELQFERLGLTFRNGLCDWPADGGVTVRRAAEALGRALCVDGVARDFGLVRPGDTVTPPQIVSMRTLRRIGNDGYVSFDLVSEVVQKRKVREGWFLGGATIVIGSDGEIRYSIYKRIDSKERLQAQRQWLSGQPDYIQAAAWDSHSIAAARLHQRLHGWHSG